MLGSSPRWEPLSIPQTLRSAGKNVDALIFDGERPIAVGNTLELVRLALEKVFYVQAKRWKIQGFYGADATGRDRETGG